MSEKLKGLTVYIFKSDMGSCDNGCGISHKCDRATLLPSDDFPMADAGVFEPDSEAPPVVIVKRHLFGGLEPYLTAYMADEDGSPDKAAMFGGCYISASDNRFPARYPVPLHDRKEG